MSAKVYVTNIPYDVKEEAMRRILERAGPIVTFDLTKKDSGHVDREHGGAGWCTYGTPADAQNAIRLLNGFHIQNRALRVAPSEKRGDSRGRDRGGGGSGSGVGRGGGGGGGRRDGDGGGRGEPAFEVVRRLAPDERWELLFQFQDLMARRPRLARELLVAEPQIAQSLALINQFVRSGRQQQQHPGPLPPPGPGPVGVGDVTGGGGMQPPLPLMPMGAGGPPRFPGPGPNPGPGGAGDAPRAPQFLLQRGPSGGGAGGAGHGGQPGGGGGGGGGGQVGGFGMRRDFGGFGGPPGGFGGIGQGGGGAPRFYAGAGSGGVVQTISRGPPLSTGSSPAGGGGARGGGQRGGGGGGRGGSSRGGGSRSSLSRSGARSSGSSAAKGGSAPPQKRSRRLGDAKKKKHKTKKAVDDLL